MSSGNWDYNSPTAGHDEDGDFQLALKLSAELNGTIPAPAPSAPQPGLDADAEFALALQSQYDSEIATEQAQMSMPNSWIDDTNDKHSRRAGYHAEHRTEHRAEHRSDYSEHRSDASTGTLAKGLAEFMTSLRASKCEKCRKHLFRSAADCNDLFQNWLTRSSTLSCRIACKSCSTFSCVACHSKQSTKLSTVNVKGKQLSWCCGGGRLFLIWVLLCGFDQHACAAKSKGTTKSKSKPGYNLAERAKPESSKPARGAGVGFGGRESYSDAYYPGGMGYGSALGGFTLPSHYGSPLSYDWKSPSSGRRGESIHHEGSTKSKAQDAQHTEDKFNTMMLGALEKLLPSLEENSSFDFDPPEALTDMLLDSKILSYCAELLRNDSLDDATKRKELYHALLNFLQKIGSHVLAHRTLFSKRAVQPDTATLLMVSFNGAKGAKESAAPLADSLRNLTTQSTLFLQSAKSNEKDFLNTEGQNLLLLCRQISELSQYLLAYTKQDRNGKSKDPGSDIAIRSVPDEQILATHAHASAARALSFSPPGRFKRLITEITTLQTGLPPGIFVRYCENRPDVLKVIIIGPSGTPYENGIFEFDFWCDGSFPLKPPQVKFKGTGGGRVSINPNLYADGKVCLSLLGTWQGEPWKPGQSTLLQVVISLQAMVFCDEPWYNEPGRETRYSTGVANDQAAAYNHTIRELTVRYAMLAWLERPTSLWHGVVTHHFQQNSNKVFEIACQWAKNKGPQMPHSREQMFHSQIYGGHGSAMDGTDLDSMLPKLQTLLHTFGLSPKNKAIRFNQKAPPSLSNPTYPRFSPYGGHQYVSPKKGYEDWGVDQEFEDLFNSPKSPKKGPSGGHGYPALMGTPFSQ
ncbi:hypothetical protein IQ07DRAFT_526783 [Pyrenochaeta sp. DS3sAY3a]|nr:hypothetical protein IQ07DRAFT_526783 [Pyrenochaeta sp. DS3sAY3a]